MRRQYRSEAMASVHETMEALHEIGAIDKKTMRRFDEACLTAVRVLTGGEIRAIREKERVSQTVFANYLNVTTSLVSQWERGDPNPSIAVSSHRLGAQAELRRRQSGGGSGAGAWRPPGAATFSAFAAVSHRPEAHLRPWPAGKGVCKSVDKECRAGFRPAAAATASPPATPPAAPPSPPSAAPACARDAPAAPAC